MSELEHPVAEHSSLLANLDQRMVSLESKDREHRDFYGRLNDLEKTMGILDLRAKQHDDGFGDLKIALAASSAEQKTALENYMASQATQWREVKEAIEGLKSKGGKTWDQIKTFVMGSIVAGLVAFLLRHWG
jgi:hypothetical protein